MKKIFLYSAMMMFLASFTLQGQKNFVVLEEQDNVTISYRWKTYKTADKEEACKLQLKIKNHNDHAIKLDLEVGYYWDALMKASSGELYYCLKKKKAIIGDMRKSGFDSSEFTCEDLMSDRFTMELNSLEITEVTGCTK